VRGFFQIVRSLVSQKKSVIFISHKLKEVLEISDNIVILRNGRRVGTTTPAESDERALASMMVGREVILTVPKGPPNLNGVVLDVQDLYVMGDQGALAVEEVSFQVFGGEIVGVAGVQGNGQTELVQALTGLRRPLSGSISISGVEVTLSTPRKITETGSAHIPEDRQQDGLVLSYPIADNLILNTYYLQPNAKGLVIQEEAIQASAGDLVKEYDVRTPSIMTPAGNLSGGNQQKVIVARELSRPVQLTIASQPTRGLDVGSIEYIHRRLVEKRDEGAAVFVVSAELDEVMSLADRIIVMFDGKIMGVVSADQATKEDLGLMMAGVLPDSMTSEPVTSGRS
jgi:simple sugar transport system ATP-binding protein